MVTQSLGRDSFTSEVSSSPFSCSAGHSRMIPRPLRASSHNMQRIWGCRSSAGQGRGPCRVLPMPQRCHSCHRGNAPKCDACSSDGSRRMFQQRRPHLEAILPPACGFRAARRARPPIAARASPLHRPPRAPTSACAAEAGGRAVEHITSGQWSVIIGRQMAGSSEVDCFGH